MNPSIQTSIQVQRIRAISLTVEDVDRSKDFYCQALGFASVSDITVDGKDYCDLSEIANSKIRIVTLKLGDEQIELVQYVNIQGKPIPLDSQSNDLWFQHLAIVVSDMDRAYAHLKSFPIKPISTEPQTFPPDNVAAAHIRAFKFRDYDRHDLELIWFPPDKGQSKWHHETNRLFLGIDHSAIAVANTEQSLLFYRDLLGMQVQGSSLNWREIQARLDNLPNAMVKVTSLRPIQGGMGIELLDYIQPSNGRPIPTDWKSYDIAHMQIELIVDDIFDNVEEVVKRFTHASLAGNRCLVKDPNGHNLLIRAIN
ncbi:VOC family protein (plasmid) [Pseudanabaena biceps]|nr:VOC family protein [Pseudanabaena biceps]